MNVYFAGSIRGASFEGKEAVYKSIIDAIRQNHTLLSEHAAVTGIADKLTDEQIYARDIKWIIDSNFMIAEVSAPSLGVGYEIAYALAISNISVLCLYKQGVKVSAMLTGNPNLSIYEYATAEEAASLTLSFLS